MNELLYVAAASYQRYVYWCREKGYQPNGSTVRYIRNAQYLRGLSNVRVLGLEGWTDRDDWRELYEMIIYVQRYPRGTEL